MTLIGGRGLTGLGLAELRGLLPIQTYLLTMNSYENIILGKTVTVLI